MYAINLISVVTKKIHFVTLQVSELGMRCLQSFSLATATSGILL